MSLRYKVLAAVIGITVVALSFVLGVIIWELVSTRQEVVQLNRELYRETIFWINRNRSEIYDDTFTQMPLIRDIIRVPLDEKEGVEIFKEGGDFDERKVRDLVERAVIENRVISEGGAFAVPDEQEGPGYALAGTYFRLQLPEIDSDGHFEQEPLQRIYIVMLAGVVVIILVIYVVLSRAVIRPIERLERAAKRVARGDYTRPVPRAGRNDEIDTLVDTFNAMMVEVGSYRVNLEDRAEEALQRVKIAEKNLTIAQRLAATGKLASGIAHEVNNPLAGMVNAARRLRRDADLPREKVEEYLDLIIDGLQRVQETVKKVLQFTPHEVAPRAVDIENVLQRTLALTGHRIEQEGLEIVVDIPANAQVYGDPFELQQVFLNILLNAMDAVAEAERHGEIVVRGAIRDGELSITVGDNGCGMDEEHVSQAFDLFFTTKEVGEGTGLGLSIAHNVIQNHGGRLSLSSVPGEGTTVEVILPLLNGEA